MFQKFFSISSVLPLLLLCSFSYRYHGAINVQFSYQGGILKFRTVRCIREAKACKSDQNICSKIFKSDEMLFTSASFVGFYSHLDVLLIYLYSFKVSVSYFPAADTVALSSFFPQLFFCKLPEITFSDSSNDLVSWNIPLDTLESYPFRQNTLYLCNQFSSFFVRKSLVISCFPEPMKRSSFGYKGRVNFEIVWLEARIFEELFETFEVQL